jgi:pimeloyl-ACP methyl ester carboxylesterase
MIIGASQSTFIQSAMAYSVCMMAQSIVRLLCLSAFMSLVMPPAWAQDAVSMPPPGRLLRIADTTLHILCTGAGAPTIVLQAGLGGNVLDWTFVQPRLAARHRVCSFDRPGAGWSSRTDRRRSAAAMTEELHLLLRAAQELPPYVMVGHSLGGLLALHYAQVYRAEISGLVLLDAMHPDQFTLFPKAGVALPDDPHLVLGRTPSAAAAYGLPAGLRSLAMELAEQGKARVFIVREMRAFTSDAGEVRARPIPNVAARVLIHGNREWDQTYPDGRMEHAWAQMQAALSTELGAPPPIVVPGSGHQIPLDDPQAVVDAVEALIQPPAP